MDKLDRADSRREDFHIGLEIHRTELTIGRERHRDRERQDETKDMYRLYRYTEKAKSSMREG